MLEGTLGVRIGHEVYTLLPGQELTLPARLVHQWWNPTGQEVMFQVTVTPARNLEATLEAICGMAQAGVLTKQAMPRNPFRLAQFGRLSETYLPVVPLWLQRVGLAMGAALGRLLGYDPSFAPYRTLPASAPAQPSSAVEATPEVALT